MRFVALFAPALAAATPVLIFPDSSNTNYPSGGDGLADSPDPNQIQIISASFSGNGCPQGSVSTSISPDKTVSCRNIRG